MTPDASNTITHHPGIFQLQNIDRAASSSRSSFRNVNAASTSVEPLADDNDTIVRNVSHLTDYEIESQVTAGRTRIPRVGLENDPYGLSLSYKTESDLEKIKANTSRKRDGGKCLPSPKRNAKKIQGFYENQNAAIERMLKSVEQHRDEARQEFGEDQVKFRIAVYGSLAANVILTALQLYAAISSGSLSLFTTMADAIFDPLSNLALIFSNRAIRKVDPRRFPAGKARLETIGNIAFCFIMTSVSLIIIAFAAQELVQGKDVKKFHLPSVISVCAAFATKFGLFLYC